jgi:two-component system sensor histidine kinase UhpB
MAVSDNGKGFDLPGRIEDLASAKCLGIMGMSERARLLHGTLDIKSEPGKGTQVVVRIPS